MTRLRLLQAVTNNTGYAAAVLDAIETCREMLARLDVIAEQTGKDTFSAQQQVKAIMAALQADAAWINTIINDCKRDDEIERVHRRQPLPRRGND